MSNSIVSNVYRYVIDDVINQVRGDFEDMGIDDSILQELQRSWESKVARSRVANFGFRDDGQYEEDDDGGNNNATGFNANNNTTHNTNNNVNSSNDPAQSHYPPEYNPSMSQPSAASLAGLAVNAIINNRPSPPGMSYGLPSINSLTNSRDIPDPNTLVNQYQMMQTPQNPNSNLPQNDGAKDITTEDIDRQIEDIIQSSQEEENSDRIVFSASSLGEPLALDNLPDHVKNLMKDARERAIKAGALSKKQRIPQLDGEGDEDPSSENKQDNGDDDINSDLDDTDDENDDGEGGEEVEHIILCLYDKVTRTKNKWKCVLKDGIMLVNGRDYLFHRASGDFEW